MGKNNSLLILFQLHSTNISGPYSTFTFYGKFLFVKVYGRLRFRCQNFFLQPGHKVVGRSGVPVVIIIILLECFSVLQAYDVVWMLFIVAILGGYANDVIRRCNHCSQIFYYFRIIAKPFKRYYCCHENLPPEYFKGLTHISTAFIFARP